VSFTDKERERRSSTRNAADQSRNVMTGDMIDLFQDISSLALIHF